MLDVTNHQRNAIENHSEIPPHTCQKARMWRKVNTCTLLLGMQTGAATVENSMEVSQNIKTVTDPVIPLLGIYLQNPET